MGNEYFIWHKGRLAPDRLDPDAPSTPELSPLLYYVGILREMNPLMPEGTLKVLVTWELDAFDDQFRDSIVFLLGDERYQTPSYASRVRAIFKTGGIVRNPFRATMRLPSAIAWREAVRDARNLAIMMRRRLSHPGLTAAARTRMFEIPLGYHKQVEVPFVPFDQRGVDVCFAGTIRPAAAWSIRPSDASRHRMADAMDAARRALPHLRFEHGSGLSPEAYSRLLADSRVVLCPRGNFDETFRLFESARAGCIAVAEAPPRRWYYADAPLAPIIDWSNLTGILRDLFADREALAARAARTQAWWHEQLSERAIARFVCAHLGDLEHAPAATASGST